MVPPQRPGKPAKAPLADLSHSEATETDDADPGTPSNPAPLTAPSRAQADQVGLAAAASVVAEAAARPPKAKGTIVTDDGNGGVAIADFLSAQKFI